MQQSSGGISVSPELTFPCKDPVQLFWQTCCLLEQEIFRVLYSANRPPEILAIEITLHRELENMDGILVLNTQI